MKTHTMNKFPVPIWDYSKALEEICYNYPHRAADFGRSFSRNQFYSKSWLVEHLYMHPINNQNDKSITILGSWYGTVLVPLLLNSITNIKSITFVDYDQEALDISKFLFSPRDMSSKNYLALDMQKVVLEKEIQLEFICADLNFDMPTLKSDIIINTSCEHMWPMKEYQFEGLCVFQSNNFKDDHAHINCVESLDEFVEQSGLTNIDFKGQKPFHVYDNHHLRFMVIGTK